jgi:ATP-dependent DNA helicase RecG
MLNQQGGTIVVGVDDRGEVIGVNDAENWVRELHAFVTDHLHPAPLFSASIHDLAGADIVMIDVPQGADKPYSLNRSIYVRVGQSTFKADPAATAEMVEVQATLLGRWERDAVPGFTMSDCDVAELMNTRKDLGRAGRLGMAVADDDEELLRRLRLLRNGQYTNAAVLLFAADPLAWSPNLAVRVVSYAGDQSGPISNDLQLSGPGVRVLHETIFAIQQRTGFSGQFSTRQIQRMDVPAYALFALREGLVNAVVHRDYTVAGGQIRVEIFPEHLVISNPGKLPDGWEPSDLKKEHSSIPGNPDVARVFYLRGLMEQLGMGTQKLIAECRELGARAPVWTVEQNTVSLTLYRAPEPKAEIQLTDRQAAFLATTKTGQTYKTSDYAELTGVVARQAQRELGELLAWGFLERHGKGPATVYIRTEKAH